MNILYLEHYAGSPKMGMEFRPYYLSREWVKMGHNVRIVAGDYSHHRGKNPQVNEDFQSDDIDGITYTWLKTGSYEGNGVERALSMYRFVTKLRNRANWIAKEWKPDVILTSSTYPMDTWAGQKIRKACKRIGRKAVLIHELHDMWPISLYELGGMKKSNPFAIVTQKAEDSYCRKSDAVVSLLCAAKDYLVEHGMAPEKFHVVVNGIVKEEWDHSSPLPQEHAELLSRLRTEGKFIIGFFGGINKAYSLDYLLQAMKKTEDPRAVAVLVGEGDQKEELKVLAGEDLDKRIFFLPWIPKTAIPALTEAIDCCYVGALKNDMFRFGICMNKLFDSMMSGKPILYAVEAPNNYIVDYKCGISVAAEDADALADGLKEMLALSEEERAQMGKNGREAVLEHFTYEKLAKQFVAIMEEGLA